MDPVLAAAEAALVDHFGQRPARASMSFVGVDPIEILRVEPIPGERAYLSLGMSRHPMTAASDSVQALDGPRGELMLHLRDPLDEFADVWRRLAILAAAPAVEGVVYTAGMTVDLGEPFAVGSRWTGGLVVESAIRPVTTESGPVTIMSILPATAAELAWCRVRGADSLRARWTSAGTDLLDPRRSSADLR